MSAHTKPAATRTDEPLAIAGGKPLRSKPFAPWPVFDSDEIEAATAVLHSGRVNYWTGEQGAIFERVFASFTRRSYAVALANGSVALELALHALEIGPGDEVIVPSRSFIASASCVTLRGAKPVFSDVDAESGNITAETIRPHITPRTRAIIVVHLAGWPCDMDPIRVLAREHKLKIIEDCAQAIGASYRGSPAGSFGDAAAFSFCQDKIISTGGEGGMLVMDNEEVWKRAWSYKDHGKDYDASHQAATRPGFRWLHASAGTNWRMTEMQSAMGCVLLRKVDERVATRNRHAAVLANGMAAIPGLRVPLPPPHTTHAYYKFYAFVRPEKLQPGWDRDRILAAVTAEGIPCFEGSCSEIYREQAFAGAAVERLPVARALGETSLMFLVHTTLTEDDMYDTVRAVAKVMAVAARDWKP
jgi:dTDP-4-amino-4,6-dideoxygalactose transaminase